MNFQLDQLNLVVAFCALISSIVFFIINWQHSKRLFEKSVISELDLRLERGIWRVNEPLILSITNLGEASVKNVSICLQTRTNNDKALFGHILQPFGMLAHESRSFSVEHMIYGSMKTLGFLRDSADNELGYELITDNKSIFLVRIECTWESGVYKVNKKRTIVQKCTFNLLQYPPPHQWQIVEGWRGVSLDDEK